MSEHKFKSTNIKGKEYVQVNERIKYFRTSPDFKGWSLVSEIVSMSDNECVIKATIFNSDGVVVATGHAHEDKGSSMINRTSFIENCETSAWGRALGNMGVGIDTSIASSEEVEMAIAKQEAIKPQAEPTKQAPVTQEPKQEAKIPVSKSDFKKAIDFIAKQDDKQKAVKSVLAQWVKRNWQPSDWQLDTIGKCQTQEGVAEFLASFELDE